MIAMRVEDVLGELGSTMAAAAGRIEDALEAAKTAEFDVAVLDVNLQGQNTAAVAEALAARSLPFVFATGYGAHGMPRSEEHTSELQSPDHLVCRLLLEKKKHTSKYIY